MDKHINILIDLYIWFYTKYNNESINITKLRNIAKSTITCYLEYTIIYQWNWDVDMVKQIHETRTEIITQNINNG